MNKNYDIRNIGDRAKGVEPGGVLPDEVEYARKILRERAGDIYGALYIVGLCGNENDASLFEKYIFGQDNNIYAEVALKSLCRYLGLIDKYRYLIRDFIMNSPDDGGIRRMTAIHLTKEYFEGYRDNELGCELVRILCDFEDSDRSSARASLADILNMRSQLKDPHGLDFDEWDDDSTLLVEAGRKKFHCPPIEMNLGGQSH